MLTDSNGATWWWEWLLAALAVVTLAVAAVFTAGIVAAALAGAAISGGISLVSQAISGNGLNWGQFALDLGIGAISGALGATSISRIGSMFVGGVLNSGSSIASDAINGQSINWLKAGIALGTGMVSGYLAGAGGKNIKAFSDELGSIKTQNWNKAMSNMIKYQINIANGIYSKSGAIGVMALANYRLNLAFVKDFALFGESAIKQTLLYLGLGNIVNMLISNIFTIF